MFSYFTPSGEANVVLLCLAAIEASIIARGTVGFSGADLENLVNQAALKAAVDGKDMVTLKELEFAKDKILVFAEMISLCGLTYGLKVGFWVLWIHHIT